MIFNSSGNGKTDDNGSESSLGDVVSGEVLFFGDIAVKLDAGFDANVPPGEIGNVFMSATGTVTGSNIWLFDIEDTPPTANCLPVPPGSPDSCAGGAANLQLAFHNDGFTTVLYGYDNATRTVVLVDESDGTTTLACDADTVLVMGDGFNDTSAFKTSIPPPPPE